ncbi:MAG: hypothetical protein HS108_02865 [Planctomycetes bacterium]|nr:hypothetical protein [Planctomycetota bacterium]
MANALRRAKSSKPDELALIVSLTAGDSGLSRRGMACLLKLRRSQLRVMEQSRGALVRLQPGGTKDLRVPAGPPVTRKPPRPLLDMAATCADSPLAGDYLSLFLLQLAGDYPERGKALRSILAARRDGLDVRAAAHALWHARGQSQLAAVARRHKFDSALLAATLWAALKPLCEAVAAALTRHVNLPTGTTDCPVCGGPAWARFGGKAACAICETRWRARFEPGLWQSMEGLQAEGARRVYHSKTGRRLVEFDKALFKPAFHAGPMIELIRLLEQPR